MNFKVVILIISLLALNGLKTYGQVIVQQGFEQSAADTWSVTFSTPPCNSSGDVWDYETSLGGISPSSGSQFWGIQDLEGNCGSSNGETITTATQSVAGCTGITASFDYNVYEFDNGDDIFYEVFFDGASQGQVQLVNGNSNFSTSGWQTETINVPNGTYTVQLVIIIDQDGAGDYAGIDNIILSGSGCGSIPSTETDCSDGIDNDGDGQIDCADGDCAGDPACTVSGSSCTYELELFDDFGDGWNGNSIVVSINGSTTNYTVTDPPGTQNIITLNVNDGDVISIQYDNSGNYDYENEITLTDGNGDILFQDGQSGVTPSTAVQTFTVDCSTTPGGGSGCTGGTLGPVGGSCGCLSGCDLTSLGGPSCGSGVTGNCTSQNLSVDIPVPDGCTYLVIAEFQPRTGCSASGADGSDFILVDEVGGSKTEIYGGGDASIADNFTLVGPGTIRVSGLANRADEIITYTISSSGATCVDCMSTLPIDLKEFNATPNGETVDLTWATASEINNDYFTLEKSKDGYNFEELAIVKAIGNSSSIFNYKKVDVSPYIGVSYYRLKQTDMNGDFTYSDIKSVFFEGKDYFTVFPNPAKNKFTLKGENLENAQIVITNSVGQLIQIPSQLAYGEYTFDASNLSNGHYLIRVIFEGNTVVKKLVITK